MKLFDRITMVHRVNKIGAQVWEFEFPHRNIILDIEDLYDLYNAIAPYVEGTQSIMRRRAVDDIKRLLSEQKAVFSSILNILEISDTKKGKENE